MNCSRYVCALLIAGALLAGCDVSSPANTTPPPTSAATPASPGGAPSANPTGYPAPSGPSTNPTGYPAPGQVPTATFPPGYVPPTPQP